MVGVNIGTALMGRDFLACLKNLKIFIPFTQSFYFQKSTQNKYM